MCHISPPPPPPPPCWRTDPNHHRPLSHRAVLPREAQFIRAIADGIRFVRRCTWPSYQGCWGCCCSCWQPDHSTELRKSLGTWLREISSCSCLTFLPNPAWVLLSKICKDFFSALYTNHCSRERYSPSSQAFSLYTRMTLGTTTEVSRSTSATTNECPLPSLPSQCSISIAFDRCGFIDGGNFTIHRSRH